MSRFARIADGRERWSGGSRLPRHHHDQAYAAVVLAGFYEECGSRGRFRVGAGDVLIHGCFESHLDRFGTSGATILNLVIRNAGPLPCCIGSLRDADTIARAAESDGAIAWSLLCEQVIPIASTPADWPDMLARDLLRSPQLNLGDWARDHRLAVETLSRGFHKIFGITPAEFRLEARARKALARIIDGTEPLAAVAVAAGFADQAHMSRATKSLTGETPGRLRAGQIGSRR